MSSRASPQSINAAANTVSNKEALLGRSETAGQRSRSISPRAKAIEVPSVSVLNKSDEDAAAALQLLSSGSTTSSSRSSKSGHRREDVEMEVDNLSLNGRTSRMPSAAPAAPEQVPPSISTSTGTSEKASTAHSKPPSPHSSTSSSSVSSTTTATNSSPDGAPATARPTLPSLASTSQPIATREVQPPPPKEQRPVAITHAYPPTSHYMAPATHEGLHVLPSRSAAIVAATANNRKKPPRVCSMCGTTETPTWRRGPKGASLCNACGLRFAKPSSSRTAKRSTDGNSGSQTFQHPSYMGQNGSRRSTMDSTTSSQDPRRAFPDPRHYVAERQEEYYAMQRPPPRQTYDYAQKFYDVPGRHLPYASQYPMSHEASKHRGGEESVRYHLLPTNSKYLTPYAHEADAKSARQEHERFAYPEARRSPLVHAASEPARHGARHVPLETLPSVALPKDASQKEMRLLQYTASSVLVCQPGEENARTENDAAEMRRRDMQWPLQVTEGSLLRERHAGHRALLDRSFVPPRREEERTEEGRPRTLQPSLDVPVGLALPEILQEALVTNQMAQYVTGWQLRTLSNPSASGATHLPPVAPHAQSQAPPQLPPPSSLYSPREAAHRDTDRYDLEGRKAQVAHHAAPVPPSDGMRKRRASEEMDTGRGPAGKSNGARHEYYPLPYPYANRPYPHDYHPAQYPSNYPPQEHYAPSYTEYVYRTMAPPASRPPLPPSHQPPLASSHQPSRPPLPPSHQP